MGFGDKKKVSEGVALANSAFVVGLRENAGVDLPHDDDIWAMSEAIAQAALKQGGSVEASIHVGRAMFLRGYGERYEGDSLIAESSKILEQHEDLFRKAAAALG